MDEESDSKMKSTKAMIRSVLISEKNGVPASRFLEDYREITGEKIPFKLFGFSRVEDFIRSIPDVVRIGHGLGEPTYYAVANEATAHIQSLVAKQRSKKPKPLNRGHVRFPKTRTAYGHRPYNGLVRGWSYRSLSYPASGFYKPTFKVRIPLLPSPNVSEKYCPSPLLVTVRNKTDGSEETERLIKRKAAVGNTGKELISKALRTVIMSGDSPDKKINYMSRYEVPPRFQHHHSTSSEGNEKPIAADSSSRSYTKDTKSSCSIFPVVAPSLKAGPKVSQGDLPTSIKEWAVKVLKNYPNGLWFSRFEVLYLEEYGVAAPSNLLELLEKWPIITIEEMIGDRYLLHLARTKPQEFLPQEKPKPVWQDFFISDAKLLPLDMSCHVYVSFLRDPLDFYVQEENSCVDNIVAKLGEVCKGQMVPDMSVLSPGIFCAALYHETNAGTELVFRT
ncbi:tudor domain-containing protein 7-like isoform X2 [Pomacea canaliculata]|uniref:tudor domain-containing protein 7-like isoform X2 n=1 Tax=Pomacea canaliculata TaxID=400727 RepID=UPI000D73B6EB|nr:tudor domain-containing protein 7-like isoform X2 [Pomacea canaliculata]